MKKFLAKAKSAINESHQLNFDPPGSPRSSTPRLGPSNGTPPQQPLPAEDQAENINPPLPVEIARYRYQHGTNLGTMFVLEKWLCGSMFAEGSKGSAELAGVEGCVKAMGIDGAKAKFEKHWNEYCSDADLDWLVHEAKCNSIRLPVGYFTLGPAYCADTPFSRVAQVYTNAWKAAKSLTARCATRGIGVLLDLHALPGGANNGDHSGTNSGKADLWKSGKNLDLAMRCLLFIAKEARSMDGVIGVQLLNEAEWDAKGMYDWYDRVIGQMGGIDSAMPLYISDAWNFGKCVKYCNGKNSLKAGRNANPVIIDTHLYWAFTEDNKRQSPQQITQQASNALSELDGNSGSVTDKGAVGVVVGEYSCVMTEDSWAKISKDQKDGAVRTFGQAQSRRHQLKAGGSFFWTYKMDWMDGGEWGFKQQVKNQAITPPTSLTLSHEDIQQRIQRARSQQDDRFNAAFGGHCSYWDGQGGNYEHFRFEKGWRLGFSDAEAFFTARAEGKVPSGGSRVGGDKIGFLDLWIRKRIVDSGQAVGACLWEWEAGFRQGVGAFYELVGV